MVVACTFFAGAAQVLLKMGALHPMPQLDPSNLASLMGFAMALLGNFPLIFGYGLHGCNALLLILALRDGELSVLYPIYSLSYVWVIGLSMYFFHDQLNPWKICGVVLVMTGVGLLGKASSRA
jgi:multidrug transporter EmrE-like cation transporter